MAKCKHKKLFVFSEGSMHKRREYMKGVKSTHYVTLACRDCNFVLCSAGSINLPEALPEVLKIKRKR